MSCPTEAGDETSQPKTPPVLGCDTENPGMTFPAASTATMLITLVRSGSAVTGATGAAPGTPLVGTIGAAAASLDGGVAAAKSAETTVDGGAVPSWLVVADSADPDSGATAFGAAIGSDVPP